MLLGSPIARRSDSAPLVIPKMWCRRANPIGTAVKNSGEAECAERSSIQSTPSRCANSRADAGSAAVLSIASLLIAHLQMIRRQVPHSQAKDGSDAFQLAASAISEVKCGKDHR